VKRRKTLIEQIQYLAILIYNAINIFSVLNTINQGICPIDVRLDGRTNGQDTWAFGKLV